jgi:hypothetical protein
MLLARDEQLKITRGPIFRTLKSSWSESIKSKKEND